MKSSYYFIKSFFWMLVLTWFAQAQVPNGDFEEWGEVNPVSWQTTNIPGFLVNITKSSDAHSGDFALRGEVLEFMGSGLNWPPFVIAGDSSGFSIDQKYASLTGYYKFFPQGGDILQVIVVMYSDFSGVGAGTATLQATSDGYQSFDIPIEYYSNDPVDNCYIEIFCGDTTDAGNGGALGTYFLVDDLSFSGVTAIGNQGDHQTAEDFILKQNYPNPFNPSTTIEFDLPEQSIVTLQIFDVQGREVQRLINDQMMTAAVHRVTWLASDMPSGVYFYRLTAGNHVQTRRMLLVK